MPPSYAVPSHYRFSKFSRKEAPDGRGRTFVPDDISIRIRLITRRPLLFPSFQTRSPVGSPRGSLPGTQTLWASVTYGVSTFRINTTMSNLGPARPPVAQHLRRRTLEPSILAPYRLDAGRVELASRFALQEPKSFGLRCKTLHTHRSSTPRRMALLDTGGRTPGCVLNCSASFHFIITTNIYATSCRK